MTEKREIPQNTNQGGNNMFVSAEQLKNLKYDLRELYEDIVDILDSAISQAEYDDLSDDYEIEVSDDKSS